MLNIQRLNQIQYLRVKKARLDLRGHNQEITAPPPLRTKIWLLVRTEVVMEEEQTHYSVVR